MSDKRREDKEKIDGLLYFPYILLVGCLFSLDRVVKYFVASRFFPGESIEVLKKIFHITLVQNTGIAFGLLRNKSNLSFVLFVLGLMLFSIILLRGKTYSKIGKISLCLIISGALSNLFDRLVFGYVIDYLDFRVWPVFNIADASITAGVALIVREIFVKKESLTLK
ncbi:MAG: signal peptidase II [Candidatus Omnitrophica bacterium]|nr:signal peptidase II [Candidatus Omnitrophota bacterium]